MIFVWFFTIPAWVFMMALVLMGAIWEKFGSGIVFIINLILTILCFLCIPAFLFSIWCLIEKTRGKDIDMTWKEVFEGLVGTGIWALIGVGYFGNMVFG